MNKTLGIFLSILWGIAGLVSLLPAVMSFMLFDAPGSTESKFTWAFFWSLLAMPLFWFIGAGLPWLFRNKRFAIWLFAFPFIDLAVIGTLVLVIDRYCGGLLSCK